MTTTVYDAAGRLMTSDSRWSKMLDDGSALCFVDDTGFDKIVTAHGGAFLFAGDSSQISNWKKYLAQAQPDWNQAPSVARISLLILATAAQRVLAHYGQDIQLPDRATPVVHFAGSGSRFAAAAWAEEQCGRKAVQAAHGKDDYTGGETKFLELPVGANNLTNNCDLIGLNQSFLAKGMVMYMNDRKVMPVQEAAANDARVKDLCEKIAQGAAPLSAPCDAMYMQPTNEDTAQIRDAIKFLVAG